MKIINLGCNVSRTKWDGSKFPEGTVHIDMNPDVKPDIVWNIEDGLPPGYDSGLDEIHAYHFVEHIGKMGEVEPWFRFWGACWRALKPMCKMFVVVPHYLHESAVGDPGHVRLMCPQSFIFLDRRAYARNRRENTAMTQYGIDFDFPTINGVLLKEDGQVIPRGIYVELEARKTAAGELISVEEFNLAEARA